MAVAVGELVNPVHEDDIGGWARAMAMTFLRDPQAPDVERRIELQRRNWEPARTWGVRDGGRWVATLRTEDRWLSVPGVGGSALEFAVDAVTNVTVAATHRRRGLMGAMLRSALGAARDRGAPLSILIAAEWPIYGGFGYSPATLSADLSLHTARAGATLAGDQTRVRQVERAEFGRIAPDVYAVAKRQRPGQLDRPADWWNRWLGLDGYAPSETLPHNWLIHEGSDGADGLLSWKADGGGGGLLPPYAAVDVADLVATSDEAYRDLWCYLTGIDLIDRVRLPGRPVDEPVRWLLADGRALVTDQLVDFVWVRLLDVAAALSARRYAVADEVVLELLDDDPDVSVAGRYALSAAGASADCRPTERAPDLELTQAALASIYLGGFGLRELAIAGGVHELTGGAVDRVAAMFATPLAPWNATWF